MIEGKKTSAVLPESWRKSFNSGVIIPAKKRFCNECTDKLTYNNCNNQTNENKEFAANLNFSERDVPNEFGHMLPYYEV